MRVFCYYLRASLNHSIVLLVKLKDATGGIDGDRMLSENGIFTECGRLICVEHSGKLVTGIS